MALRVLRRTALLKVFTSFLFIGILLLLSSVSPAGEQKPIRPTVRDKCPVCGMFVAKYPDFVAEVVFRDGSYSVFDGAKDLFKYLAAMERYTPGRRQADIVSVYVTDYYTVTLVDGRAAYYVIGSDVLGPMGRELIPFENEADAREFMKDHRGKAILRFGDVTPGILKGLD